MKQIYLDEIMTEQNKMRGLKMNKLNQKDMQILAHLRQDARRNLTNISRDINVPVSTIFDRMKKYHEAIIKKDTILINFKKLGYELKVNVLLKTTPEKREDVRRFLEKSFSINSIYRINNGFDFLIEAIFENMLQFQDFNDELEKIGISQKQEFYILEDIKEQAFISEPALVDLVV